MKVGMLALTKKLKPKKLSQENIMLIYVAWLNGNRTLILFSHSRQMMKMAMYFPYK
jgi:hypothetical protein